MKLTDQEMRKFSLYCKHMQEMGELSLRAKETLLEKQKIQEPLKTEITKREKLNIVAYMIVSQELDKWSNAETITAKDIGKL